MSSFTEEESLDITPMSDFNKRQVDQANQSFTDNNRKQKNVPSFKLDDKEEIDFGDIDPVASSNDFGYHDNDDFNSDDANLLPDLSKLVLNSSTNSGLMDSSRVSDSSISELTNTKSSVIDDSRAYDSTTPTTTNSSTSISELTDNLTNNSMNKGGYKKTRRRKSTKRKVPRRKKSTKRKVPRRKTHRRRR